MLTQAPKGTKDVPMTESYKWQFVEERIRQMTKLAGLREVRTPMFEHTELFLRSVGDTTDVVQKEMYTFMDKGGRSITLKPEGTASVVRSFIESRLYSEVLPAKMYYLSMPNFRYEKPQNGRLREFHQFGVEVFGAPLATEDAELISLAWNITQSLGVTGLELHINSIGCPECRAKYYEALRDFFQPKFGGMCENCKDRFERNPMRLLDCKEEKCKEAAVGAPKMIDYLCEDCSSHFEVLKSALGAMNIDYTIDPQIVRGLDYYTKTVFEIIAKLPDGPLTVCGGGRYDNLIEEVGGPKMAGVGFGMGMERLLMVMERVGAEIPKPALLDVYIANYGDAARLAALKLCSELRALGVRADIDHAGRSMRAQFKYADKIDAGYVITIGEDEMAKNQITLRQMVSHEEKPFNLSDAEGIAGEILRNLK